MLKLNICIFKFKLFKNITEYFLPKNPSKPFTFQHLSPSWPRLGHILNPLVVSSSTDGCCLFWSSFWNVWPAIVRTTPHRTPPVMLLYSLHPANTVYSEWYQIKIDLTQKKITICCVMFKVSINEVSKSLLLSASPTLNDVTAAGMLQHFFLFLGNSRFLLPGTNGTTSESNLEAWSAF